MAKARNYPQKGNGKGFRWIAEHLTYQGDDCIQWPFSRLPQGRGIVGYNGKRWHASRLMCTLVHGEPPTPEHQAAHSCGNGHKACMNPKHLSWKTPSENRQDCKLHGTNTRGAGNGSAGKLTYAQALEIRALQGSATGFQVADRYGVHPNTIYMIWQRKTFKSETQPRYPAWTPEQDERLREATRRRMTNEETAAFVGRSISHLWRRRAKLGISTTATLAKER